MFIGVYAGFGMALHEEAFDSRPCEPMTRALAWGEGVQDALLPISGLLLCSKWHRRQSQHSGGRCAQMPAITLP